MELLLDTVNIEQIKHSNETLPVIGVTSNPSILKKENVADLFEQLMMIKSIIGNKQLHVQVVGQTKATIIEDAHYIAERMGKETFIKVPVTQEGLAAIQVLKKEQFRITATAIYTEFQGYLAIAAGVDYLAPYYNRMEALNINSMQVIHNLAEMILRTKSNSKIVAASFKNIHQVNQALQVGAQAVTVSPDILTQSFAMPSIQQAVVDFQNDWEKTFHTKTVKGLDI